MSQSEPQVFIGTRDVVAASGDEAVTYLQGQISQDVVGLAVGSSAWSFILQPQGKVDAWFRITRIGTDSYLLDVDAGFGEVLLARLNRFKLRTKVDLTLDTWMLHAYEGDAPNGCDAPIMAPAAGGTGTDVIGPELGDAIGSVMSPNEYDLRRIRAGIPKMGAELDETTIPAESLVVDMSASFTKGCYTGQELVARVDSRGNNTPRRLRIVSGQGEVPLVNELRSGDVTAGQITSVVPNGEGWIGLAYIKRSFLDETELTLAGSNGDARSADVLPTPIEQQLAGNS